MLGLILCNFELMDLKSLLLFSPVITNRLKYTCDFIFDEMLGVEYNITSDQQYFEQYARHKIAYGSSRIDHAFYIKNVELLFEKNIHPFTIFPQKKGKQFFLFPIQQADLHFDIFAATFYMISRYEEYLPHTRDHHDRFRAEDSMAFKHGFLHIPIVDQWILYLKKLLQVYFPEMIFSEKHFSFIPTIDVDQAYAIKDKGFLRQAGALVLTASHFRFEKLVNRIRILSGIDKDPFDNFDWIKKLHDKYQLQGIFFLLMAEYGEFDKNIETDNPNFQSLIKTLGDHSTVGIHPSYHSNESPEKFNIEKDILQNILNRSVTVSRQHYLKLNLPNTYYLLLEAGIKDDYTMGFSSQVGFRAGTCSSFYFYDLKNETSTQLKIHPFAVMDVTLQQYLRLKPEAALARLIDLIDEVKKVNGTFITLWHNESLSEDGKWKGWRTIYEKMVNKASSGIKNPQKVYS